jgi:hypothetical protein
VRISLFCQGSLFHPPQYSTHDFAFWIMSLPFDELGVISLNAMQVLAFLDAEQIIGGR